MLIGDEPDRTQCDRGHRCVTQACDQTEPEVVSVNQPVVGQRPKFNRRAAASFNKTLQRPYEGCQEGRGESARCFLSNQG